MNSVETWSKPGCEIYSPGNKQSYNFTSSASQAFGSNMIQVNSDSLTFAIYNGDVNQDGTVDATDLTQIDNDAFNFMTGYVITDMNGDEVIDASDAAIADNNASNFVSAVTP